MRPRRRPRSIRWKSSGPGFRFVTAFDPVRVELSGSRAVTSGTSSWVHQGFLAYLTGDKTKGARGVQESAGSSLKRVSGQRGWRRQCCDHCGLQEGSRRQRVRRETSSVARSRFGRFRFGNQDQKPRRRCPIGDDGVVVIDSFASANAAQELLTEIRQRTKLPIKFVMCSHRDGVALWRAAGR